MSNLTQRAIYRLQDLQAERGYDLEVMNWTNELMHKLEERQAAQSGLFVEELPEIIMESIA